MTDTKEELEDTALGQLSGGSEADDVSHYFYKWIWCPTCRKSFRDDENGGRAAMDANTGEIYLQCPKCGKLVSESGRQL